MTDVTPASLDPAAPSSKEETPEVESARVEASRPQAHRETAKPHALETQSGRNGGRGFFSGLIGGIIGGGAVVATLWFTVAPTYLGKTATSISDLDARISGIAAQKSTAGEEQNTRLQQLDQRLSRIEQTPEKADTSEAKLTILAGEIAAIQQTMANLQQSLPPQGLGDRVTSLSSILGNLQPQVERLQNELAAVVARQNEPSAARRAALTLAVANLARATETAVPFSAELGAVAALVPSDDASVQSLKPLAVGVPTLAMLESRFPATIDQVIAAVNAQQSQGFWSRLWLQATRLVTIRRTGPLTGDSTEAVLSRMEAALAINDLEGAATAGAELKGQAAEAAKPWLQQAQNRITTDAAVQALNTLVAEQLANPKG